MRYHGRSDVRDKLIDSAVGETRSRSSHPSSGVGLAYTITEAGSGRPPTTTRLNVQAGDAIGRYTVERMVGEGGMGVVFAAIDVDLQRTVALKLLRRSSGEGSVTQAHRQRLLREARAMARLEHPNVLTVYEVGAFEERDFICMPFVDGSSLAVWLRKRERPWREVMSVFLSAAGGLEAAHEAGLVHRDFKPANVLINKDGRVLVSDFGLAHLDVDDASLPVPPTDGRVPDNVELTRTGALLGTPAYMAPEQHLGLAIDARTDQYSFCVAMYEGLFGVRPFIGDGLSDILDAKRSLRVSEPVGARSVPTAVRAAIIRGMAPDPAERFSSMSELTRALRNAVRDATPTPRPRILVWLLLAALAAGACATVALWWAGSSKPHNMRSAPALAIAEPVPDEPDIAAEVRALRERLRAAGSLSRDAQYEHARTRSAVIVNDARSLGYRPVLAEALLEHGRLASHLGLAEDARRELDEALLLAQESAHGHAEARAFVALAEYERSFSSDREHTLGTIRRARVAVTRAGDASVRAELKRIHAAVLVNGDSPEEGLALARRAIEMFRERGDVVGVARAQLVLADHLLRQREREAALTTSTEAWQAMRDALGERHIEVGLARERSMHMLWLLGRVDEARRVFDTLTWLWQEPEVRALIQARSSKELGGHRAVSGRVIDANGDPVAEARVVASRLLLSDSKYLTAAFPSKMLVQLGTFVDITDEHGRFSFPSLTDSFVHLVAESSEQRSYPVRVDPGASDDFELVLHPVTQLRGRVALPDVEVPGLLQVMMMCKNQPNCQAQRYLTPIASDGMFEFSRLLPGTYAVRVMTYIGRESRVLTMADTSVVLGRDNEVFLDLDQPLTGVDIDVVVRGSYSVTIPAALVIVTDPGFSSQSLTTFRQRILDAQSLWQSVPVTAKPGERDVVVPIQGVAPGWRSFCAMRLPGDVNNPTVLGEFRQHEDQMRLECSDHEIAETPDKQTITLDIGRTQKAKPAAMPAAVPTSQATVPGQ